MDGQKSRWNGLVQMDLQKCGLEDSWRFAARNRNGWHSVVKSRIEDCNRLAEEEKKRSKDEQKRRREDRQMTSTTALSCDHSGCDFMALSEAGMANHKCQNMGPTPTGTMPPLQPDLLPPGPAQPHKVLQHETGIRLTRYVNLACTTSEKK